uniref:Uncharacterized protein n=1 Tax=Anopheles coluzzii TaxID=1518534 RepID=A0A8W7PLS6_ANOCL
MEPPRTPFSLGLKPKSHCATGRMMLIPTASFTTVIMLTPESTDRMICTFPKPVNWSASSNIATTFAFTSSTQYPANTISRQNRIATAYALVMNCSAIPDTPATMQLKTIMTF